MKLRIFIVLLLGMLPMTLNAQEKSFRFEDYSNGEKAARALLKLHPIGSDVMPLKETLENAGANCTLGENSYGKFLSCFYIQKGWLFAHDRSAVAGLSADSKIKFIKASNKSINIS